MCVYERESEYLCYPEIKNDSLNVHCNIDLQSNALCEIVYGDKPYIAMHLAALCAGTPSLHSYLCYAQVYFYIYMQYRATSLLQ